MRSRGHCVSSGLLASARALADGSVLVRDASGKQMASYSADQVEQVLGASGR